MFFSRLVVTALSFGATALAAPIGVPGVALPVDSLVPGGSSLPIDITKLPLSGSSGLPLPISGGSVPSLGGGSGGIGLPLARREESTYTGALDNLGNVAGGLLNNDAQELDASSLLSGLVNLNSALKGVTSVLGPMQGLDVDSLLNGASLDNVTKQTQSVFQLVNQVTSKVQSMGLTSDAKDQLLTTVKTLNDITSGLGIAPELQSVVKGCLAKVLGLVGGLLQGLGINL
ncbi:unnamed protein product [Rhizoctonia solani]|uniref:Uncharacterized protein n=1 Tax=Rhizoctonia solani TaxID=456999 RepID=A0A8H2XMV2_9AGAM|nr:unnamed protein product [Rhizoctonia solani]